MRLNKIIQRDYTSFSLYYQIKLPLDLEISIPSDDPVRLVSAFVEEMDLSELYKTYGRIRKNQARLYTKLTSFVAECEELYGIRTVYHDQISIHTLKRLKKQLCRVKVQEGIVFVHGIGRRKTQLQKSLEQLDQY